MTFPRSRTKQREALYADECHKALESGVAITAGMTFGALTTVKKIKHPSRSGIHWVCECVCRTERMVYAGHLRAGQTKSCGCRAHIQPRNPMAYPRCGAEQCSRDGKLSVDGLKVCLLHYQRWRDFGALTLPDKRKSKTGRCIAQGCDRKLHSKNSAYCRTHYFRVRRGSAGGLAPIPAVRSCVICETDFEVGKSRAWTCSAQCAQVSLRRHVQMRRGRLTSKIVIDTFSDHEIFRRDRWICQLCKHPINRFAVHPSPVVATLDHIIPLSRGGYHVRSNAQTAHSFCNSKKGRKLLTELALPFDPPPSLTGGAR